MLQNELHTFHFIVSGSEIVNETKVISDRFLLLLLLLIDYIPQSTFPTCLALL